MKPTAPPFLQFSRGALLALAVLFSYNALAQSHSTEASGVAMQMTKDLNSAVQQGIATMNSLKRNVDVNAAAPAVATPVITKLKMDKMNSRYVENDGEIYDRITNLTWSRCSLGQRWVNSKGCVGMVRQISFDQAQKYVNDQWRLPTRAELTGLIDHTKTSIPTVLTIDSQAFPDMDLTKLYYWTATEENTSFAWAVLFIDSGIPSILYRSHRYAVRLVHSGK